MDGLFGLASQTPLTGLFCVRRRQVARSRPNTSRPWPHLQKLLSHPIIKLLLPHDDAPAMAGTPSNNADLTHIRNTLTALTKAVDGLQTKGNHPSKTAPPPPHTKGKDPSTPPSHTYSAIAGSRPPNPSLVVSLAHLEFTASTRPSLESVCCILNERLSAISPLQVQLAAVRWTAMGNLVVTGGPSATPASLQLAAPHISIILSSKLQLPSHTTIPPPRANVKWSKIALNGVPTSMSSTWDPYTPDKCHSALAAINPSYASLTITQKPSWVLPPSSYLHGSASSLSMAFEDPDGSKLKMLLAERYLYVFGNRASVKKWKQHRKITKVHSNTHTATYNQGSDVEDNKDIDNTLISLLIPVLASPLSFIEAARTHIPGPNSPFRISLTATSPPPQHSSTCKTQGKK